MLLFKVGKEAVLPRPSNLLWLMLPWQLLTFLPEKEAIFPQQLLTFPQKETVHPRPTTLPQLTVRHQVVPLLWQLLTFLPGKEAILSWELLTFSWVKVTAPPRQLFSFPQGKEAIPPRLLLSFHTMREAAYLRPLAPPRQVKLIILPGHLSKVIGSSLGTGQPSLPWSLIPPPGKTTPPPPHSRPPQGSSNEEPNPKWVINLSNKPLTPAQRSILAKGPTFAVTPRQPPNLEYITAIEAACTKLSQQDAEELRADINRVLRSSHPPKPNLTKAQNSALRELKRDRDRIVLTADMGVAMVIMYRQDYINKANHLLNQSTYKVITKDPTNTIKNKLINILKGIKTKTGLRINTYKSMYPTDCVPPKFYGLPKIHKPDAPLRPIVSSCGSVTYGVAKELAKILKPLVGKSPHHITSPAPRTLLNRPSTSNWNLENVSVPMMCLPCSPQSP